MKDNPLVFEQRGKTEDEIGKGCHIHFIANKDSMAKNHLFRELKKIFQSVVGNDLHINIKPCPESWRDDKIAYMKGEKWEESKLDSVKLNKDFREKYNLDNIYYG